MFYFGKSGVQALPARKQSLHSLYPLPPQLLIRKHPSSKSLFKLMLSKQPLIGCPLTARRLPIGCPPVVMSYKLNKYSALYVGCVGFSGVDRGFYRCGMEHALSIKTVSTKAGRQRGHFFRCVHEQTGPAPFKQQVKQQEISYE